jgi:hypothetical protein
MIDKHNPLRFRHAGIPAIRRGVLLFTDWEGGIEGANCQGTGAFRVADIVGFDCSYTSPDTVTIYFSHGTQVIVDFNGINDVGESLVAFSESLEELLYDPKEEA